MNVAPIITGRETPSGSDLQEAKDFLAKYPDIEAIDLVLTDCHGIGRGKIIRRHELESLFTSGRAMPGSLFAQDVAGDDVVGTGLVLIDGGADQRCWPVPGTLGCLAHIKRGQVLVSMYDQEEKPFAAEPRHALVRQVERARALGYEPMGAFELEFYLVDMKPNAEGRYQPARYALTGRRSLNRNTMAVDELDQMSPFFDAVYESARYLNLTLEALISEYAVGQYELTIRYRDLLRAADDVIVAKRLIRLTARRFGFEACFMAKPFGSDAGSGMHLHLSLADAKGNNLFADQPDGHLSPLMLQAIAGVRGGIGDTMAILAPFLNSWRRFASTVYSPVSDTWGIENRTVGIRVPASSGKSRHFEHRVAGVDSNPYLTAPIALASALDGIAAKSDPGPPTEGDHGTGGLSGDLPRNWLEAIERLDQSTFAKGVLGPELHQSFVAVKRAEWQRMALEVSEAEWSLYGFVV